MGTGLETSVNRIYQLVAEIIEFRREPRFGPPREGDLRRSALDAELAARELGWRPWTALEVGLPSTMDSLRSG